MLPPASTPDPDSIHQRAYKFHQELRLRHIEQYKARVRKQNECTANLNHLLADVPRELDGVARWCQEVTLLFTNSHEYRVPDYKIVELFKLIERFPCLETVTLLHAVSHRMSSSSVNELFQYDVVGLLHKLMLAPEKLVPRVLLQGTTEKSSFQLCLQISKKSMQVLAALCEQSERARNFIVINHKSYLCVSKVHQKLGPEVHEQYIYCLYAFTKHTIIYDEQFIRIFKSLALLLCNYFDSFTAGEKIMVIEGLTAAVRSKQRWAMDLIEESCQYDILEKIDKIMKQGYETTPSSHVPAEAKLQGRILHQLNLFLIHYTETTTNQYFPWESFLAHWFHILSLDSPHFQQARRDVYFIFNNIICDAEEPTTSYHLLRSMVFQHGCVGVFALCLDRQTNEDLLQELGYCVYSLLVYKDVGVLAKCIQEAGLVRAILEAVTRNFYMVNAGTREALLVGLTTLVDKTQDPAVRHTYSYQIKCYQSKLQQTAIITRKESTTIDETLDTLLQAIHKNV